MQRPQPTVQWQGDNAAEVENLLRHHAARADQEGDRLHIMGLAGLDLMLEIGDSVIVEGDRLGVLRKQQGSVDIDVTWTGGNLAAIVKFMEGWNVRPDVVGADLFLHADGGYLILNRGDKLILRSGKIVISKVGKDHRAS